MRGAAHLLAFLAFATAVGQSSDDGSAGGCLHPGGIDYGLASPPFPAETPRLRFKTGSIVSYECKSKNYLLFGISKLRCDHPIGWTPPHPPRCKIQYDISYDGTRQLEDPFWVRRGRGVTGAGRRARRAGRGARGPGEVVLGRLGRGRGRRPGGTGYRLTHHRGGGVYA